MIRLVLILPFLVGCAAFQEQGEAQQDAELANNKAEVEHAEREICTQIRAGTVMDAYKDDLPRWHSFCGYE